jgi:23S rRNA maturation-related 3'-5' exoribonuclease YhaM
MLTQKQIQENKELVITRLSSTSRPGIFGMIEWLETEGFFTSPASTKYHGCYQGGLAQHSLNVLHGLLGLLCETRLNIPYGSMIICALLHDVCKVGAYIGDSVKYEYNKAQPAGHAELSITRIENFITLTELERLMIRYHMGIWAHTSEELKTVWNVYPEVRLLYFADELAALKEKHAEAR